MMSLVQHILPARPARGTYGIDELFYTKTRSMERFFFPRSWPQLAQVVRSSGRGFPLESGRGIPKGGAVRGTLSPADVRGTGIKQFKTRFKTVLRTMALKPDSTP